MQGKEASSLPLDADLPDPTKVVISIDPGPIYTFRTADIENVLPGTDLANLGFDVGEPAKSDAVRDAGRVAVTAWAKEGYAKADIPNAQIIADHEARQLDATLNVVTGPKVTYGPVSVSGTNRVKEGFLEYMTDLPRGETYDPERIEKARRRLLKLDAFGVVDIEEQPLEADKSMPISVTVQDRKPRRFGLGATISTLDGIGVEGFWLHRNILSQGERLRFDASVNGIGRSLDPQDYDYELGVTFIKPGALTPDTDFRLNTTVSQEKLDNYDALIYSLSAGYSSVINERTTGSVDLVWEESRIDDSLGRRRFALFGFDAHLTYERRDVPLDATKGYYLDLEAFPFYESKNGKFGLRTTAEARAYTTLGQSDKFVLAGRAKIGSVGGLTLTEAPPQVLFFSGGGGSIRGFQFQANGVTLPGGQEVGGRSLIEASAEVRTKLNENFGIVGFIDAGIVGPNATPDFTAEIDVGVGMGLRWRTGGLLASSARVEEILVSDQKGPWLIIKEADIVWTRRALFSKRLKIDSLKAASIQLIRPPLPDPSLPTLEAEPFSLPELPLSVEIGVLDVPKIEIGEELLGQSVSLALNGFITLADGSLDTKLDVLRTDRAGVFAVEASYQNESRQLDVDLAFQEPDGGLVA